MQRHDRPDFSRINFRSLSAAEWTAVRAEIMRRAHAERDEAIRTAFSSAFAWVWRELQRLPRRSALRAAWISHVRKRREQIAAAQLRALSDPWLADYGADARRHRQPRPFSRAPRLASKLNHLSVRQTNQFGGR
jgi:hypothetical protein